MILKKCDRCGKIIQIGKKCECSISKQNIKKADDFYISTEWKKAREICISRCFGVDLYSFFILNKFEYGRTVHHIVPLKDDYSLCITQSNLICLTDENHRLIHRLYDENFNETVEILHNILRQGVY